MDGGSAVLGWVAMVRLSLASPAPFRTLKEKVMLKLSLLAGVTKIDPPPVPRLCLVNA
jgi:hypothetical protein